MAISTRSYARPYLPSGGLPEGVKGLIIANSAVFLLMWLVGPVERVFSRCCVSLGPADVVTRFFVWQLVSYLFLHGGFFHILFNMLALWFFGKRSGRHLGHPPVPAVLFLLRHGSRAVRGAGQLPVWQPPDRNHWRIRSDLRVLLVCAVMWPDRIIIFYIFPDQAQVFRDDSGRDRLLWPA